MPLEKDLLSQSHASAILSETAILIDGEYYLRIAWYNNPYGKIFCGRSTNNQPISCTWKCGACNKNRKMYDNTEPHRLLSNEIILNGENYEDSSWNHSELLEKIRQKLKDDNEYLAYLKNKIIMLSDTTLTDNKVA